MQVTKICAGAWKTKKDGGGKNVQRMTACFHGKIKHLVPKDPSGQFRGVIDEWTHAEAYAVSNLLYPDDLTYTHFMTTN